MSLAAAVALAMSCIRHVYEEGELELTATKSRGKDVPPPAAVIGLVAIMNSSDLGEAVLLQSPDYEHGKFYKRADGGARFVPTLVLETACKTNVPIVALRPGKYTFDQEHRDGRKTPRGIARPTLAIDASRTTATLSYEVKKKPYVSTFRIKDLAYVVPIDQAKPASDKAALMNVIRANINQIRHCYEAELGQRPDAAGQIDAHFTIAKDGSVSSYAAGAKTTIRSATFLSCVERKVKAWKFHPPADGKARQVTYPFVFNPF